MFRAVSRIHHGLVVHPKVDRKGDDADHECRRANSCSCSCSSYITYICCTATTAATTTKAEESPELPHVQKEEEQSGDLPPLLVFQYGPDQRPRRLAQVQPGEEADRKYAPRDQRRPRGEDRGDPPTYYAPRAPPAAAAGAGVEEVLPHRVLQDEQGVEGAAAGDVSCHPRDRVGVVQLGHGAGREERRRQGAVRVGADHISSGVGWCHRIVGYCAVHVGIESGRVPYVPFAIASHHSSFSSLAPPALRRGPQLAQPLKGSLVIT